MDGGADLVGARSRVGGCLLAAACGQGLGLPFRGRRRCDPEAVDAAARGTHPLPIAADTTLMVELACHLGSPGGVSPDSFRSLALRWATAWRADPYREYQPTVSDVLRAVEQTGAWRPEYARSGYDDLGCGPVAWIAPVGLLPFPLPEVAAIARNVASITHRQATALEAAVVGACAVAVALRRDPEAPVDQVELCLELAGHVNDKRLADRLVRLPRMIKLRQAYEVAGFLDDESTVVRSVLAAVAAYLRHVDSPAAAIRFAIALGGATSATAGLAGAIAGARSGSAVLPTTWLRRLPDSRRINDVADGLARWA